MIAALLFGALTAGCETDSDWLAANGGLPDYIPTQSGRIAECGGLNDQHWLRLASAPTTAENYLRYVHVIDQETDVRREDKWYTRKPGEVLLCRSAEGPNGGGYQALWRFREKDGHVIVAESYAWSYVVVN